MNKNLIVPVFDQARLYLLLLLFGLIYYTKLFKYLYYITSENKVFFKLRLFVKQLKSQSSE
jgi:hypothetical protein